jgi:flagellar protein FlgJ
MKNIDSTGKIAIDANSLNALKTAAKENSPETIKEVAKQFEAVFMNMMLKSMREATPQENPFDNEQSRTFTSMLDQQLTSNLASKGLGLSDILAKQLSKGVNITNTTMEQAVSDPKNVTDTKSESINSSLPNANLIHSYLSNQPNYQIPTHLLSNQRSNTNDAKSSPESSTNPQILSTNSLIKTDDTTKKPKANNTNTTGISSSSEFKNRMIAHAEEASKSTGIPSKLMLGQAALESGWGKREIKGKDGTPSYNLFGIKATAGWTGKTVETVTTEYVNGEKQKHVTKFRAYDSYADSFKDFAKLMQNNPRYQGVMSNLHDSDSYAQAMQKAGYATDPNYADKLASVINKVSSA